MRTAPGVLCLLLAAGAVLGGEPDESAAPAAGILIQMENYDVRSREEDFARRHTAPHALGRICLTRFFPAGAWCGYDFTVETSGRHYLWLRCASTGDRTIRWAVDPKDPADAKAARTADIEGAGVLQGPKAYAWSRLGAVDLATGTHRFVLHSAPVRPDAVWIGRRDAPVDDEAVFAAELARTRRHLANPIEPVAPDWLAEADDCTLPAWYDRIRVCAHTRLSWQWRERKPAVFNHAGAKLASIGFKEISRHIKSGSEAAWWPSSVGAVVDEAKDTNVARQIIDEARDAGCRILVYHRHMEDRHLAETHPQWTARDADGGILTKRGPKICFNTPYADFIETRLVELARMGADGFYFDEVHMPKPFCWCENCRRAFKAETGMDYPERADPFDPAYQKAIEFKNVTIERLFRRLRKAIHDVNPACVLLVASNTYPRMDDRHTTHRLYRITDSMKTEFSLPARSLRHWPFGGDSDVIKPPADTMLALGYAIARDACDGRPPHVWTHGLPNALHARFATAGLVAHGAIANLDHREGTIPDHDLFGAAVAIGNRVAPALAGKRPVRWAAVHFSEHARDHDMPHRTAAWLNVLHPTWGMFATLLRARMPVTVVTDSQLAQGRLEGVSVLLLPAPDRLTDGMRRAVAAFEGRGGCVIRQRDAWGWHAAPDGFTRAAGALRGLIAENAPPVPVRVTGGPEKMHAVAFVGRDRRRLTVTVVNDFSWVFTGRKRFRSGKPNPAYTEALARSAPPPCEGVTVHLRVSSRVTGARDAVTGAALESESADGETRFGVPGFDCLAVVTVDMDGPLP